MEYYKEFNMHKIMELKNEAVFRVDESLVKDKVEIDKNTEKATRRYVFAMDFAEDYKIYYTYDKKNKIYIKINTKDYDKYNMVFKLISFTKDENNERYYDFKVMKC